MCIDANGAGTFQIDLGPKGGHPDVSVEQAFDPAWAANYAANMLATNMNYLGNTFPNFTPPQLIQAAAASYNFGTSNIHGNPNRIDVGTTNNNYGIDILFLMDCF
jgi:soluble lytic murein transglycosylase-like protein